MLSKKAPAWGHRSFVSGVAIASLVAGCGGSGNSSGSGGTGGGISSTFSTRVL